MIYLDYQATTPVAPEVSAAMRPWIKERFGNPHSPHRMGREAAAAVEVAREQLSALFAGASGRLVFTSGATEAANWALKGSASRLPPGKRKVVTVATEHACVLDTVGWLAGQGFETEVLPVGSDGLLDLDRAADGIDDRTGLVAAMLVNNEIGVIQPVEQMAALAHAKGARFFCDAAQGLGRVPLPVVHCDMIAVSGHKVHGPKGIGALWLADGVDVDALLHGGGQEAGMRSGTLSPALCAGFGEAARLLRERAEQDQAHVAALWNKAHQLLGPDWELNGSADRRYHGNLNVRFDGLDSARLISEVRQVAFSAGSACASGSGRPSHVLAALGLDDREARSSIRIGYGRYTSDTDFETALRLIAEAADHQRRFAA